MSDRWTREIKALDLITGDVQWRTEPLVPAVEPAEVLRALSGDHDLLWLKPGALLPGDVLMIGGATVRTVLAPVTTIERPSDVHETPWADGFVAVRVTAAGACWELPAGTSVLALRPIECPVCGRPERHNPDWCVGATEAAHMVGAWQSAEAPF